MSAFKKYSEEYDLKQYKTLESKQLDHRFLDNFYVNIS